MSFKQDYRSYVEKYPFKYICAGGFEIGCRYHKEREPTVILLVGGLGVPDMFFRQFLWFSKNGYSVLSIDYPIGCNTNEMLVAVIVEVIDCLNINKPVFVGQSFGGFLAQQIVSQYPGIAYALVLSNTGTICRDMGKENLSRMIFLRQKLALVYKITRFLPERTTCFLSLFYKALGAGKAAFDSGAAYTAYFLSAMLKQTTKEKRHQMYRLMLDLENIDLPEKDAFNIVCDRCLLLLSEDDNLFGTAIRSDLIKTFCNAQVNNIQGGHMAFVFNAEGYSSEINGFLEKVQTKCLCC